MFPDFYDVCLTAYDSISACSDEYCEIISVEDEFLPMCIADFNYTSNILQVTFENISQGVGTNYYWDFGDGVYSTESDPVHTYNNSGYYDVCLQVFDSASSCMDQYCIPIPVDIDISECQADFTFLIDELSISFFDNSYGEVSHYSWNFGDGYYSTDQNPVHLFQDKDYYNVCLSVLNIETGCISTFCRELVLVDSITQDCNAEYEYFNNQGEVTFSDISLGTYTDWLWEFGDGTFSNDTTAVHSYEESDFYEACLTIYDSVSGCLDEHCKTFLIEGVEVVCIVEFDYVADNQNVNFLSSTEGDYTDIFWSFGDGYYSYIDNPNHYFNEPGFYEVCVTIYDSISDCLDEYCEVIIVSPDEVPICNADFIYYTEDYRLSNRRTHIIHESERRK